MELSMLPPIQAWRLTSLASWITLSLGMALNSC